MHIHDEEKSWRSPGRGKVRTVTIILSGIEGDALGIELEGLLETIKRKWPNGESAVEILHDLLNPDEYSERG